MSNQMSAEIVIIGGGAVGCGVAYSLAQAGKTDVMVVEKEPTVAAVTTSQAAGLVGQIRTTVERVKLAMWSVQTFSNFQKNEQSNPAWRQVGSLRIALTDERVEEFKQLKAVADGAGLEVEFIDNCDAKNKWPVINFDRVKAILWCPSDGYLQPYDLTMAYVTHSRKQGVRYMTNTSVEDIVIENGEITGVVTSQGKIQCKSVINAAGAHAYHIAKLVGLVLPIVPVRHEFLVTVHSEGLEPTLPVIRIPDLTLYLRAEVNSLLVGGWEPNALSTSPNEFELSEDAPNIDEDWGVLGNFGEMLSPYISQITELGIRSVFKGWPTFTPDGRFIIGESCRVKGFIMAGGCNAHGVSGSAGIGRHVVESMLDPAPSPYVKSLSPDRFTEISWNWNEARTQAQHVYETYYVLESH